MKEINVENIIFKVKDFLPYKDLDKLNIYGYLAVQIKLSKYQALVPKKNDDETLDAFAIRMTKDLDEETVTALMEGGKQMLLFDRAIDELLITEPIFEECRASTIKKLKETPEYQAILLGVKNDMDDAMKPQAGAQDTSKNQ